MTFQDNNGNILQFDGEFAMSKKAISFFDFTISGDVSLNFTINNNSENRKVLGYYGPMMSSQIAWTKQPFNRMKDGNILDKGYIVIQSETDAELNCFYVSGNYNWIQGITGLITELDYTGQFSTTNYEKQIINTSLANSIGTTSGICFPLVDWCFNLEWGSQNYYLSNYDPNNAYNNLNGQLVDSTNDPEKPIISFYPCFYISSLIGEIFQQKGFKIIGTLLNDPLFKSLIITPQNGLIKRKQYNIVTATGVAQSMPAASLTKYTSLTETSDLDNLFASNAYTSNKNATLKFTITFISRGSTNINYVNLKQNGSFGSGNITWVDGASAVYYRSSVKNDVWDFYINNSGGGPQNATMNIKIEIATIINTGDYVSPEMFLPKINCFDLIKNIFCYFGCVIIYDDFNKTITANIIDKIDAKNADDWSNYYLSHRNEYTISVGNNNYLQLTQPQDTEIVKYNNTNNVGFGEGNITTPNTLLNSKDIFKFEFAPTKSGVSKNGYYMPNIPLINLVPNGDAIPFSSIYNPGGGQIIFVEGGTLPTMNYQEVYSATNSAGVRLGFFNVVTLNFTGNSPSSWFPYYGVDSGFLHRQNVNYNDVGIRILSVNPSMQISDMTSRKDFSNGIQILGNGTTLSDTIDYPIFCKELIGNEVDNLKNNLAFDNPVINGSTFQDPSIKTLYFSKISKMYNNASIRLQMYLPEAIYQSFNFSKYIYLNTEKLQGYFWIESIVNYKDSATPTEVNVLKI